jgi:multidrug efflux pump subunit AcrA (membrane-fusion protein)
MTWEKLNASNFFNFTLKMKSSYLVFIGCLALLSCKDKVEKIKPIEQGITESVYASGLIKSGDQYQAFATASGIVSDILVKEGDTIKKGDPILKIFNQTQRLNKENAELNALFSDFNANQGKLNEARLMSDVALSKMKTDSSLFFRQKKLFDQSVGTQVELEQRELAYQNSRAAYYSSKVKFDDLRRQLELSSNQSKRNLEISNTLEGDYTLKSEIDGKVYELLKEKGEIVGPQTPLAIIGAANHFILEMQVDEYDIFRIKNDLQVLVSMDSYKGQVFEARITKIFPIMNERSKSFLVEAEFVKRPERLYPNVTFEANIVLMKKDKALLIPRNCLINDSTVKLVDGSEKHIKTGLRDYQMIEVLSGLSTNDEIIKSKK